MTEYIHLLSHQQYWTFSQGASGMWVYISEKNKLPYDTLANEGTSFSPVT